MINLCANGEVISSNAYQPDYITRTKENAFDTDMTTMWASMGYPLNQGWIGYNFKKQVNIKQVLLTQLDAPSAVSSILLQGSNDGISWIDINTYSTIPGFNTININNNNYFFQYRLMAKSNTGTTGWAWGVYDIKMLGFEYKFLIKQYGQYYSIKPSNYDTTNKTYMPLELSGGSNPNTSDIETYGFSDIRMLELPNTINGETFKPIDKMYSNFEIKQYKGGAIIG